MPPLTTPPLTTRPGLVKELHGHNGEMADKFLGVDGTFVLLRKLEAPADAPATQTTPTTQSYAPLLENCAKVFSNTIFTQCTASINNVNTL